MEHPKDQQKAEIIFKKEDLKGYPQESIEDEIRLCWECLMEFPLICFRKCTGGTGYRYICKSCYNQRVRKRVVGHCTHIFKFGPNKGKVCPNNCYNGVEKCSRHSDKTRQYQNAYISKVRELAREAKANPKDLSEITEGKAKANTKDLSEITEGKEKNKDQPTEQ